MNNYDIPFKITAKLSLPMLILYLFATTLFYICSAVALILMVQDEPLTALFMGVFMLTLGSLFLYIFIFISIKKKMVIEIIENYIRSVTFTRKNWLTGMKFMI